jgi:hypothetical protein
MRFFNVTPLEGQENIYIGEAAIFSLDPHRVVIELPFSSDNMEKKVQLFTRDGKLYMRNKTKPVEIKIPLELIECKKGEENAICVIDPLIYNIEHIAELNSEDGWHVSEVKKEGDVYKVIGVDGTEYTLNTEDFESSNWLGSYVSVFKEDGQLKGIIAFENKKNRQKVLMYKVNIPKKMVVITGENESGTAKWGRVMFP